MRLPGKCGSALHSQDKPPKLCWGEVSRHPFLSFSFLAVPAPESYREVQSHRAGEGGTFRPGREGDLRTPICLLQGGQVNLTAHKAEITALGKWAQPAPGPSAGVRAPALVASAPASERGGAGSADIGGGGAWGRRCGGCGGEPGARVTLRGLGEGRSG